LILLLCAAGLQLRAQLAPPILLLVSFDGWRWDYLDRYDAPRLKALAARGVRSEGLIPSYPTLTFPNHYTLVTGLTPDRHGIVSNSMFDPTIGPDKFTMSSATAKDPRWWGGEPIWTTAIRQGRKSASMFWPGSEAILPTYWKPFNDALPNTDRVAQVLAWLDLPAADRPAFITLYFSDTDTAGHRAGPDSPDVRDAVRRVDDALGMVLAGIEQRGLADRTTVVVVSDHGMIATSSDRSIALADYVSPGDVEVLDSGGGLTLNPRGGATADRLYEQLAGKHPSLAIYRREAAPAWLRYGAHARVPAIIGVVDAGWTVTLNRPAAPAPMPARIGGAHGYDPRYRDMHGLFVAAGPRIRRGYLAPEFSNIHVYAFLCEVLGLRPAANDGDPAQTANFFVR
jgi:predicted AlkP superfamily pyrophosphatase or phosphodiesterase